jgi:hypothetical protein
VRLHVLKCTEPAQTGFVVPVGHFKPRQGREM